MWKEVCGLISKPPGNETDLPVFFGGHFTVNFKLFLRVPGFSDSTTGQ
jgi:hypothetical protein